MTKHKITIKREGGNAIPSPQRKKWRVGDTVVYAANPPGLAFEVRYGRSPFTGKGSRVIRDSTPRTVTNAGTFLSMCSIENRNGRMSGWSKDNPESGGEHEVKPQTP